MTRYIFGVAAAVGLTAPALGAPAVRTTPDFFGDDKPIAVDLLSDRYLGAIVDGGDGYEVAVLDTDSWELVPGGNVVEPCLPDGASTATAPNAIFAYSVTETDAGFFVGCDGGRISQVIVTDGGDGDVSFTLSSAQLLDLGGATVEAALVSGDFDEQTGIPYVLSQDRIIYALNTSSIETSSLLINTFATFEQRAVDVEVGGVSSTGDPNFVLILADGSVQISAGGIPVTADCGGSAEDLLIANNLLYVATSDGSGAGVGVVDFATPGICTDFLPLEETLRDAFGLGYAPSAAATSGTLYASGLFADGSGSGVVSALSDGDAATISGGLSVDVDDPGSLAVADPDLDLVFNLGDDDLSLISDAPFVDLTAEISVESTSTSVSGDDDDDEDATPTSQIEVTITTSLDLKVQPDEDGTITATFNGDPLSFDQTSIDKGEVLEQTFDLEALEEGVFPLVVTFTDNDDPENTRVVTRYLSVDTPPEELGNFDVSFGDGKLIVFWDEPSDDDVAYYEVVVAPETDDGSAPFSDGDDFLDGSERTFTVTTSEGAVTWPSDIPEESEETPGTWPLIFSTDDDALESLREEGTRKLRLSLSPLANGETYYVSVRSVDSGGQEGPWTLAASGVPETTCGAACQAGDSGGFCAIVPKEGPGRSGGWLVAFGLLTYFGLRIRRRGDGAVDV